MNLSEARSVRLLEQLQAIEYTLVELNLYMDALPNNTFAKQRNLALTKQRDKIRSQLHAQIRAASSYDIISDADNRNWRLAP